MISPSASCKPETGEPSSYQHMEQALLKVVNKTGNEHLRASESQNIDSSLSPAIGNDSQDKGTVLGSHSSQEAAETLNRSTSDAAIGNASQEWRASIENTSIAGPDSKFSVSLDSSSISRNLGCDSHLLNPANAREGISRGTAERAKAFSPSQDDASGEMAEGGVAMVSALASSSSPQPSPPSSTTERSTKSKGGALRRGKWTSEEEAYVARVIQDFNSGFLNAPAGTTLRSYLSDKLECDPMRITKKFTGDACIGKRVFHPAVRSAANAATIDKAQAELDALERRWRRRLEMQQRESAKKAAASAAAANAASRGSSTMVQGVPVALLGASAQGSSDTQLQQTAVTQAASWLDRANAILKGSIIQGAYRDQQEGSSNGSSPTPRDESTQSSAEDSLENQMKEVQRLIREGPVIQQTTAGLPQLLLQRDTVIDRPLNPLIPSDTPISSEAVTPEANASGQVPPDSEPADKRIKTSDSSTTGAEDAEALVGFLRSVRASAAAGQDL